MRRGLWDRENIDTDSPHVWEFMAPFFRVGCSFVCDQKKNQSTPRPSEHPPVMGGEMCDL